MDLHARIEGREVLVLSLGEPKLDIGNVRAFRDAVASALQDHTRVVLDLERVRSIDSCGFGALIACVRMLRARRGDFRLCSVDPRLQANFDAMRMHRVVGMHPTRGEAVRSYSLA